MRDFLITCNNPSIKSKTNLCIVLDLDETLVHTFEKISEKKARAIREDPEYIRIRDRIYLIDVNDPFTRKGEGHHLFIWGIIRPHAAEFLNFCFSYFKVVAIWTAGTKPYAKEIVTELAKRSREPNIVYSRNECDDGSGRCNNKNLAKMIAECNTTMNLSNTFIVDDRLENFTPNPGNGILISAYEVSPNKSSMLNDDDDELLKLMEWFKKREVMESRDVRDLDKRDIF